MKKLFLGLAALLTAAPTQVLAQPPQATVAAYLSGDPVGPDTLALVQAAVNEAAGVAGLAPRWIDTEHGDTRELAHRALSCDPACYRETTQRLDAQAVLAVAVWRGIDGAALTLGFEYRARSQCTRGGDCESLSVTRNIEVVDAEHIDAAVSSAFRRLLHWVEHGRPMLVVRTNPPGASVTIDRFPCASSDQGGGSIACERGDLAVGEHRLAVSAPGYVTQRRVVELTEEGDTVVEFELEAEPAGPPSENPYAGSEAPSGPSLVPPVLLTTLGLAGLGAAAYAVSRRGCATSDAGGGCLERRRLEVGPAVAYLTLTAVAVGAGLLWTFRVRSRRGRTTEVSLLPRGVQVSGRF